MMNYLIAGNWKMNLLPHEGMKLTHDIIQGIDDLPPHVDVLICPPFTHLMQCSLLIENAESDLCIGAQNCSEKDFGAFTGEISAPMLSALDIQYVILGHSERRQYFNESNAMIADKCIAALQHSLFPILCCGETLEQREQGIVQQIIESQLIPFLTHPELPKYLQEFVFVIAYEPVWAIGTGKSASAQDANDVHQFIRELLLQYIPTFANSIQIIYGGSVNPGNAKEYFAQEHINGALIGGASLQSESFLAIANSVE